MDNINREVVAQIYQSLLKHYHPDIGPAPERGFRVVTTQIIQKAYRDNDIKTLVEFAAELPDFPIWDIDSAASSLTDEQERQLRLHDIYGQIQDVIWDGKRQVLPGSLTHLALKRLRKYRDNGDEENLKLFQKYLASPITLDNVPLYDTERFQDWHHEYVMLNRRRGLPPPTYDESSVMFLLFIIDRDPDEIDLYPPF